jgi:Zn-dependent peptidase ImmA (M78 family)
MITPPPIYTFAEISQIISGLRKNYPELCTLPIDMERFADVRLGLYIDEMPGLAENSVIASAIIDNFTRIVIDSKIFNTDQDASRFFIAHELGHYFLHREHFQKHGAEMSKDEWLEFATSDSSRAAELNANTFARLLLVPANNLLEQAKLIPPPSIPSLTRIFGVKTWVLEHRINDSDVLTGLQ